MAAEPRPHQTHRFRRVLLTITGVALPSSARDASLVAFERRCAAAGLRVHISPLPAHVAQRVHASQGVLQDGQSGILARPQLASTGSSGCI